MFVAADKAWYIQFFWVQLQDNYLGECVSSSTAKGVHQGSRSVADGLDLHSATNTGDWVRSLWEHGRVCVGVFDTAKLRGRGWILRRGKLWWRRAQLLGRRMWRRRDDSWGGQIGLINFFLVKKSYLATFSEQQPRQKLELLLLIQRLEHNFVWAPGA